MHTKHITQAKLIVGLFIATFLIGAQDLQAAPGDVDLSFDPGPITWQGFAFPAFKFATAIQPDGKILVGGQFDSVNGTQRFFVARFNTNGSLDNSFNPPLQPFLVNGNPTGEVYDVVLQPDGRILVGGYFHVNGQHKTLVRLNPDGSLDGSLSVVTNGGNPDFNHIYRIVLQPDGKIIIGSNGLDTVNGVAVNYLARLNTTGSLDSPLGVTGAIFSGVFAIALQPDGKILVGGSASPPIVRLNSDGTRDSAFERVFFDNPGVVDAIAVQADGRIVVGGRQRFTYFGSLHEGIFRLLPDGAMDGSFVPVQTPSNDPLVIRNCFSLLIQNDGKIVVGGSFNAASGLFLASFGRLNTDGNVDFITSDGGGPDNDIFDIARQSDGKFLVVGAFERVYQGAGFVTRSGVARLLDSDQALAPKPKLDVAGGNILVGSPGNGIIMKSPGGTTCRRLSIDNVGALVLTTVTCP